jgi:preprotein translocase subunit Sec61beta
VIVTDKYNLKGITSFTTYASGEMKDCKLNEFNEIRVGNRKLIPRYTQPDERTKDGKIVSFYENGNIKSIALQERTVILTSAGPVHAELITFYENGAVESLFPLNGQIGFGWTEEDEEQLLEEMRFDLSFASFTTKLIGLRFYNSGALKSMILWPGRRIEIIAPIGVYPARIGIRLYEDGSLESFEPAVPILINTGIGAVMAFDQNAVGVDADFNSVRFYPDGKLKSLSTNSDIVVNRISWPRRTIIYQQLRMDMLTGEMVKLPVVISFREDLVEVDNGAGKQAFTASDSKFLFLYDGSYREKKCSPGSDCSGCGASCM